MPSADLSPYTQPQGTTSDGNKFGNLLTYLQGLLNGLDNNNIAAAAGIVQTKLSFTATQTYTPTWSSTGVAPALGNGTITGRYIQIGKLVYCQIILTVGSTTTFGTGSYSFNPPVGVLAAVPYDTTVVAFDTSANAYYAGTTKPLGGNILPFTLAAPGVDYSSAVPFTWATGDTLTITTVYEAA